MTDLGIKYRLSGPIVHGHLGTSNYNIWFMNPSSLPWPVEVPLYGFQLLVNLSGFQSPVSGKDSTSDIVFIIS